ncbi:MAG: hypothetical protein Q9169_000954 [Polycauliona sp. 2 TL-2023]
MATTTTTTEGHNTPEHKEILLDIHIRLVNLTRRLDIGFASLNLVMAQIQLSLVTYHESGAVPLQEKKNSFQGGATATLRASMQSFVDDGTASQAIKTMTEDARDRLGQLKEGFEEVVGIVETLKSVSKQG